MNDLPPLSGAQRSKLRGLGQTMSDLICLGRDGVTPAFLAELDALLAARELVKLRITGGQDRRERAALGDAIAAATHSECIGTVGHTALFYRSNPGGMKPVC